MTQLVDFYSQCAVVADPQQRRWSAGAGYLLGEAARNGESVASAQARVLSVPQYAAGLNAAGLTAPFQAIDAIGSGGGSAYVAAIFATSGLVSYYRLSETAGTVAADQKAVNNGTYTGGFTLNQPGATSDGDKAVALNGTTGYVLAKSGQILSALADATVELWVKCSGVPTGNEDAVYTERAATGNDIWKFGIAGATASAPNQGRLKFVHRDDAAVLTQVLTTGPSVVNNVYHQVAMTKTGTAIAFYVDGQPAGTGTVTGSNTMTNAGMESRIGADAGDAAVIYVGSVDDVSLYNVTLSAATILDHYNRR